MTDEAKPHSLRERNRLLARNVVLDAAERLLKKSPSAEFSMRELAAEAGVGFATPFNHFGSKNAIMQALSTRLIERMAERFRDQAQRGDAIDRVLAMGKIAVVLLLEQPEISKAVVGSLGVVGPVPSMVRPHSEAIWRLALGDFTGIRSQVRQLAETTLPEHLAYVFRGCLSFWIAGELQDKAFGDAFQSGALVALLGFAAPKRQVQMIERIKPEAPGHRR